MKTILRILISAAAGAVLTGCASTRAYFMDRGRDAADVFTLTAGKGLGAKARVGFLQTGLLYNRDIVGIRSGQLFSTADLEPENYGNDYLKHNSEESEIGPVGMIGLPFVFFMPNWGDGAGIKTYRNYCTGNDQFRPIGLARDRGKEIDSWSSVLLVTHDTPQHLGQVEIVIGLFGSIRLGFNTGELLDFVLGWATIDIFDDDVATRPFKEARLESRTAHRLLKTFELPSEALAIFNQGNAQDAPQGQTILRYVLAHSDDTETRKQFIELVSSLANAERSVTEMAADQKAYPGKYSPNHGAFVYRAKYAFDALEKLNLVHSGMTYGQVVTIFGTPTEDRRADGNSGYAVWALSPPFGGGLRYQIRATVDSNGVVQSIQRTR